MKKLIVANWKMNPASKASALKLAKASDFKNVVICPPFVFLEDVKKVLKKATLGAQDTFWFEKGAYTGEISPAMLKKLGCRYVILGHSERRRYFNETDEMINKKVLASLKSGLKVILCIGENLAVRKKGIKAVQNFIKNQLNLNLKGIKNLKFKIKNLAIAYEPIWAIGSGVSDNPEDTMNIARFIKRIVKSKILYGGSVHSRNAQQFLEKSEIDGVLVGGASIKPREFKRITI